ncbi:conjugal transfer protein TraD, partial [Serratia ureilytica]|nr:conjugal transfer protein TraD [Serratia ureilytica]MDN2474001.1 conjugal transfer protein TraD [Serratia ureilytica]
YKKVRQVAHPYEPRKMDAAADGRLISAIEMREAETGNMDALFAATPILPAVSAREIADAPVSVVSTATTENPVSDVTVVSAAATATGGQEAELKQKPAPGDDDAERGELPPGISGDGEVVDIAQYEAWQAQQQVMGQQAMQRREETNITIDRHRRELAEVSHSEIESWEDLHR